MASYEHYTRGMLYKLGIQEMLDNLNMYFVDCNTVQFVVFDNYHSDVAIEVVVDYTDS